MTPEEQKELEERKNEFFRKYKELIDEYKLDFYHIPFFMPDGKGAFTTVIQSNLVDLKNASMPTDIKMFE